MHPEAAAPAGTPSLYVHSPFCARRCPYCDFAVVPRPDPARIDLYLRALDRELGARASAIRPRTVFVGGGTPTALDAPSLRRFFALLRARVDLSCTREFSVEANPEDLDTERIAVLVEAGVTRLSLGVQSFDATTLRRLGRRHTPEQARRAVRLALEAPFRTVSVDLIVSVPEEPRERLERDVAELSALPIQHASVYSFTVEPGTAYARAVGRRRVRAATEDQQRRDLERAASALESLGLRRYEVSNFATTGHRCLHNLLCWRRRPYLGVGPSAASLYRETRIVNPRDFERWARGWLAGVCEFAFTERLTEQQRLAETLLLGLRRIEGLSWKNLARWGGRRAIDDRGLETALREGLIEADLEGLRATPRGLLVLDSLLAALL